MSFKVYDVLLFQVHGDKILRTIYLVFIRVKNARCPITKTSNIFHRSQKKEKLRKKRQNRYELNFVKVNHSPIEFHNHFSATYTFKLRILFLLWIDKVYRNRFYFFIFFVIQSTLVITFYISSGKKFVEILIDKFV